MAAQSVEHPAFIGSFLADHEAPCARRRSTFFTTSACRLDVPAHGLDERGPSVVCMDLIAIVLAVVCFAALLAAVELIERI